MSKKNLFPLLFLMIAIQACGQKQVDSKVKRPNIVWLIAEDLSPDLGCYGNSLVHTPNVDDLAKNGIVFTNAFASAPVCSASRSALMTGFTK